MAVLLAVLAASWAHQEPEPPRVNAPLVESLEIGGSVRARYEWREPATYSTTATDPRRPTDFALQRTRVRLGAKVNDHIRAIVEFQDARAWGSEASVAADTKNVDLRQGFVEFSGVAGGPLTVKLGRFEVPVLGDQRLLSPLDWSNTGRSFDGIHVLCAPEGWTFHLLGANLAEAETPPVDPGNDADDDYIFAGIYVQNRQVESLELDVYLLRRNLSDDDFASEVDPGFGDRKDWTFGARARHHSGRWTLAGEAVMQWGRRHTDTIRAWAAAVRVEVDVSDEPGWRLLVEFAAASGDRSPTDGKAGTFDPLFPFGHFYHGHMDLVGWRNIRAIVLGSRLRLGESWFLHLDAHRFGLDRGADAWYDAAGTVLRTGEADCHCLGTELDLYVKGGVWERGAVWIGWSRFLPAGFVEDTGFAPNGDWAFVQLEVNF